MRPCALLRRRAPRRARRRTFRLLAGHGASDGHGAAGGADALLRRSPYRPRGRAGPPPPAGKCDHPAGPPAERHRARRRLSAEGTPVSARDRVGDSSRPKACRGRAATAPPPRPCHPAEPVRAAAAWLARRAHGSPVRPRRAAAAAPAMTELDPHQLVAGSGYPGTKLLSSWQSVGTLLFLAATRGPRPTPSTKRPRRRLAFSSGSRPCPRPPICPPTPTGSAASPTGALKRLTRRCRPSGCPAARPVQPGLPHHPPPRRRGPSRSTTCPPVPAHPLGAHLLRPGPRLHRDDLRQRRHHQGRAANEVIAFADYWPAAPGRPRPAGLRLPAHHLPHPRRAVRPPITFLTLRQRGPSSSSKPSPPSPPGVDHLPSNATGATATPRSTKRSSTSKASATVRQSPSATSATTSPPC